MNRFLLSLLSKNIKLLKLAREIYYFYNYLILKYYFGIKKVGKYVSFYKGFDVFNGNHNILIGSNVSLVDALLNADSRNGYIDIGDYVFFGQKVMIHARTHNHKKFCFERLHTITEAPVIIRKGAWIGSGSIILPGVTIGKNSVIGAGSVVVKNVDDYTVVAGVPAKFIKKVKFKNLECKLNIKKC